MQIEVLNESYLEVHGKIIYRKIDSKSGVILGFANEDYELEPPKELQDAVDFAVGEFMVSESHWSIE